MLHQFFKISPFFLAIFIFIAFFAVTNQRAIASEGNNYQECDVSLKGSLTPKGRIQFEKSSLSRLPAKPQQKLIIGRESDKIQVYFFYEPGAPLYQPSSLTDLSPI